MRNIFSLLVVMLAASCTTIEDYKGMSSGHVGCLPNEVEISDQSSTSTTESWVAICKNVAYVCNRDMSGFTPIITCTERK